ncbi:MAG TPA: 16S rRNA (guanine(966)-N(2))-methyltransferase RsmD [Syntrophomonadaceae bacterium]|nr:16S rRNA (guanine(966)-N(2))-methyltransferase RsmD [Syntrophomonadaceae bacterium]
MRVIAGKAKGKRLKAPPGDNTRPITDMIKEALFNVLGERVEGALFLDLFAGSGSVGIEALSRGAETVVFIDNNAAAVGVIRENLNNCRMTEGFEVYRNDVFRAINILQTRGSKFDLVYVDPPFTNTEIFDKVLKVLDKADILNQNGSMVIRTFRKKTLPVRLDHLFKYRHNDYGESVLHYYRICEEDQPYDGDIQNS